MTTITRKEIPLKESPKKQLSIGCKVKIQPDAECPEEFYGITGNIVKIFNAYVVETEKKGTGSMRLVLTRNEIKVI